MQQHCLDPPRADGCNARSPLPLPLPLQACGKELGHQMSDRRPGDVAVVYGDASKAKAELGWEAKLGLEDMCADSWRWISTNPNGYE